MTGDARDDDRPRRRRPVRLAPDDLSLWQRIAKQITPMRQAKPRVPEVEVEPLAAAPAPAPRPEPNAAPFRPSGSRRATPPPTAPPADPKTPRPGPPRAPASPPRSAAPPPRSAPALPPIERRQARRIAAGTTLIEARVDLHGLTQAAAHGRLVAFIESAAAAGRKTVLVITGKGCRRRAGDLDWAGDRRHGEAGVLRQSVPRWLAEPPLRALVIGYQPAAVHHGGDGALYVQLRRPRRLRTPGSGST